LVPLAEAAANFLGSKPVMEGRAMVTVLSGSADEVHGSPIDILKSFYSLCRPLFTAVIEARGQKLSL
jgi:hypothetical protein